MHENNNYRIKYTQSPIALPYLSTQKYCSTVVDNKLLSKNHGYR